jgi:hypothetical protein
MTRTGEGRAEGDQVARSRVAMLCTVLAVAVLALTGCTVATAGAGVAERADRPLTPSLEGTVWSGTDSDGRYYVFRFKAASRLAYTSPTGTFDKSGDTWTQRGATITLTFNSGYAVYKGSIVGNDMGGRASNVVGKKWEWSVRKQ